MSFIDIKWTLGHIIAMAGIAIAVYALFWDRSCGRKRCPKCWYDLCGGKTTHCSECGYEILNEKKLYKTRRRWMRAILGILVTLIGLAPLGVYRKVWIKATPTIGYIMFLPGLDLATAHRELNSRVREGDLYQWEYPLLVERLVGILEGDTEKDRLLDCISMLQRIEFGIDNGPQYKPWESWADASKINLEGSVSALIGLLNHADKEVRLNAIQALGRFDEAAIPAIPALLNKLVSKDREIHRAAINALGYLARSSKHTVVFPYSVFHDNSRRNTNDLFIKSEIDFLKTLGQSGNDQEKSIELFLNGLSHESVKIRVISVVSLAFLASDRKEIRDAILKLSDDSDDLVRKSVIEATSVMPFDQTVKELISQGLLESPNVVWSSLHVLRLRGTEAGEFEDELRQILTLDISTTRNMGIILEAAKTFVAIGGDPEITVGVLLNIIRNTTDFNRSRMSMFYLIANLGYESEELCKEIRPFLDLDDPEIQNAAAYAYVMLGGDSTLATRIIWSAIINNKTEGGLPFILFGQMLNSGRMPAPVMMEYLTNSNAIKRVNTAKYLGEAGLYAAEALPELKLLLNDSDPDVIEEAKYAIKRIEWAIAPPESESE